MPPFGLQGTINSPVNLMNVFQALIEIREESAEVVAMQLEKNVDHVFFSI